MKITSDSHRTHFGFAWNSHRTHMEFTSDSHGNHTHRTHIELTSDSHGIHIGLTWNSHRTHMEFTSDSHITHIGFIAREFGAIFLSVFLACHRPHIGRPRSCAPVQNWTGAQGLVQRWTGAQDLGQLFLYNMKADPAHRRRRAGAVGNLQ